MKLLSRKKTRTLTLPTKPTVYPPGTCAHTLSGYYYIKSASVRLRITSDRVLKSWSFPRVVETTDFALSNYKIRGKLGFRAGTLIYNIANGKMYLISDNKRLQITSPEALERIGATMDEAVVVSDDDMTLHLEGDTLN